MQFLLGLPYFREELLAKNVTIFLSNAFWRRGWLYNFVYPASEDKTSETSNKRGLLEGLIKT